MKIEEYKLKRQTLSSTKEVYREKCFNCFRPKSSCLCSNIVPFDTSSVFVLLIHPMEAKKQRTGTGRISVSFLKNSKMFMGIDFSNDSGVNEILDDDKNFCVVLYPGVEAFNVSTDDISNFKRPKDKKLVVFVIDGTWPCARKMMKLSPRVRQLPRICFTPENRSEFIIKQQPHESCLSTIESIHMLLEKMEGQGLEQLKGEHNSMLKAFRALNNYQLSCARDPRLSSYRRGEYKDSIERVPSRKWKKRKLFID